jgi:hypothetical protein
MITRRDFLKISGAASLYGLTFPEWLKAQSSALGDIYVATHTGLVSGAASNFTINYDLVKAAVDCSVMNMTGQTTAGKAWEVLFPGITPAKKVDIKVNIWQEHPVHWELLEAVCRSIAESCGNSFPLANISIHDNNYSGWTDRVNSVYGADVRGLGVAYQDPSPMYSSATTVDIKGRNLRPHVYLDNADYGISIAPLRYLSGREDLTGVCKNMMGTFSSSTTAYRDAPSFHDENSYPSFGRLWDRYLKDKPFVYILDALLGARWRAWTHVVKQVIIGQDAAAVDSYGAEILRDICGYGSARKLIPQAIQAAGAGTITYVKHDVEVTLNGIRPMQRGNHTNISLAITPQPITSQARITFRSNRAAANTRSDLSVYSASGRHLVTLWQGQAAARTVSWDTRDASGRLLGAGTYVCQVRMGSEVVWKKIVLKR